MQWARGQLEAAGWSLVVRLTLGVAQHSAVRAVVKCLYFTLRFLLPLPCDHLRLMPSCAHPGLQERRAGMEEYAEKLALASRRAERMVKEFEEMGAGGCGWVWLVYVEVLV